MSGGEESLDLDVVRSHFPSLDGPFVYFDNGGGSQILQPVLDRLVDHLVRRNVQLGASYRCSVEAGEALLEARRGVATLMNARDPDECVMGPSTTVLLRRIATSFGRTIRPGDQIVVSEGDHEANIAPWLELEREGAEVRVWRVSPVTGELELDGLDEVLTSRTRLVAATHTSNILGSINPIEKFARRIHDVGALLCVDGVGYAPHRAVDVQACGADFYAFSFYKTFGPHHAVLWGRKELLRSLPGLGFSFIAEDDVPCRFQPGNVNYELSASIPGILDYLRAMGSDPPWESRDGRDPAHSRPVVSAAGEPSDIDHHGALRRAVTRAFDRIARHEEELTGRLLDFLRRRDGVRIVGHAGAAAQDRVSIVSFVSRRRSSREIVTAVDAHGIGIRYGHFYSLRLIEALGLDPADGVVRVSMVHYNTRAEVDRLIAVLDQLL